jgi:hypothetical protein
VLDPLTKGPHSFPMGAARKSALVSAKELAKYLVDRVEVRIIPTFELPARVSQIPSELSALHTDARVSYSESFCKRRSNKGETSASALIEMFNERIARQQQGFYTLEEAAGILAEANSDLDGTGLLDKMIESFRNGQLTVRDVSTQAPHKEWATLRTFYDWVTAQDVDVMLKAWDVSYRFPAAPSSAAPPAQKRVLAPEANKSQVLAALKELYSDPLALPSFKNGKPNPIKQPLKDKTKLGDSQIERALTALRKEGLIKCAVEHPAQNTLRKN